INNGAHIDYVDANGGSHISITTPANTVPPGVWTHIAYVKQANTYSVYINGVLQAQDVDISPLQPTSTGWTLNGRFYMQGVNGFEFTGSIDELRLSNVALTPDEFLNHQSPLPDLVITNTNDLNGAHTNVGATFNWILSFSNIGNAQADFAEGDRVLLD